MPKGVYPRRPTQIAQAKINFALGHTPESRAKAVASLKANAESDEWRDRISKVTKVAMHQDDVRRRHLDGLASHSGYDYHPNPLAPVLHADALLVATQEYIDRFWSRVDIRGVDECWLFQGSGSKRSKSYGSFWYGERETKASRFALMITVGVELPSSVHALHKCDTPLCCNPSHLYAGDNAQNVRDRVERGRGGNSGRRLTRREAEIIRKLAEKGYDDHTLADDFGVSAKAIRNIISRRTWRKI